MDDRLPAPGPMPQLRRRPVCHATTCNEAPLVQWQRRLTDEELAVEQAIIQGRWDAAYVLRDTQQPDPIQPPLPGPGDFTRTVTSCADHAIGLDAAAQIHQAHCAGPDSDLLPECDCEPEPLPEPEDEVEAVQRVPAHWAAAMARSAGR